MGHSHAKESHMQRWIEFEHKINKKPSLCFRFSALTCMAYLSEEAEAWGESVDSLAAISWRETVARGPSRAMMLGIPSRTTHLMANESANANPEQLAPMVPLGNGYNFHFFNFNIMTSGGHMSTQIQIAKFEDDIIPA